MEKYLWQRDGSFVYRLKEIPGRWEKDEISGWFAPPVTNEFWFKIDACDSNLTFGKVEAEELAQRIVDFLNKE